MNTNIDYHLNRLREKPHHHKKRIAFGVAFGVTLIVGLIWLSTISLSNSPNGALTSLGSTNNSMQVMQQNVATAYKGFANLFSKK